MHVGCKVPENREPIKDPQGHVKITQKSEVDSLTNKENNNTNGLRYIRYINSHVHYDAFIKFFSNLWSLRRGQTCSLKNLKGKN